MSVDIYDIYMAKMEYNIVIKDQPKFCKRYVYDIINRRKKNQIDL